MSQSTPLLLSPPLLLATDGSDSARMAQRILSPIAQLLDQQSTNYDRSILNVLTVQPRSPGWRKTGLRSLTRRLSRVSPLEPRPITLLDTQVGGIDSSIEPLMQTVNAELPPGVAASFELRQGRPAIEILKYARTIHAGLIAIGQQADNSTQKFSLGAVSATVARYAPCHVLIARSNDIAPNEQPGWHHILLVVDSSLAAKQAIALTQQLVPIGIQKITLLCIQPPLTTSYLYGPFTSPTPNWHLSQSLQAAQKEQSEQLIQQACNALKRPHLQIHPLIQTGEPGPLICQVAQQQQVDIVLLGSNTLKHAVSTNHRRQLLRNVRLSPTADYVIHHAPCPVLLCRTHDRKLEAKQPARQPR
jgi:nucleotide-binding universal stress UspA family protein